MLKILSPVSILLSFSVLLSPFPCIVSAILFVALLLCICTLENYLQGNIDATPWNSTSQNLDQILKKGNISMHSSLMVKDWKENLSLTNITNYKTLKEEVL